MTAPGSPVEYRISWNFVAGLLLLAAGVSAGLSFAMPWTTDGDGTALGKLSAVLVGGYVLCITLVFTLTGAAIAMTGRSRRGLVGGALGALAPLVAFAISLPTSVNGDATFGPGFGCAIGAAFALACAHAAILASAPGASE